MRRRLRAMSAKRRTSGLFRRDDPVYVRVDARSGLRCEVVLDAFRCVARQRDHHHTRKPKASWHAPEWVMGICRLHHDMEERGELSTVPNGDETFTCALVAPTSVEVA